MGINSTRGFLQELRKHEIPIKDAVEPFPINITKKDTKHCIPGNPKCCVLARKTQGFFGVMEAQFYTRIAYIVRMDEETGKKTAFRYSMDARTKKAIQTFDDGNDFPPGDYVLNPLVKSERKENKAARDAKRKKGVKNTKKKVVGKAARKKKPTGFRRRYVDRYSTQ